MNAKTLRLPIPFIVASMVSGAIQPLISLVDTYFAAHLSTLDLACLTLGGGIASSVGWISGQLIGGFPGVLGRLRGRADDATARQLNGEVIATACFMGLIIVVPIALVFGEALMWLSQSETVGSGAQHYLHIRLLGLPFNVAVFVILGTLRAGYQAVWTPLLVMTVALATNTLLNVLFIWGFGWGLSGLALASAMAPLAAALVGGWTIQKRGGWLLASGFRAVRQWQLHAMTQLSIRLGGFALWRALLLNAVLISSSLVAERFSASDLGAHGLALQIWLLIAFLVDGFAHAGLAFGSRLMGTGDMVAARRFGWKLIGSSSVLCALICLLLALMWDALPGLFGLDAIATAAFATILLPMCAQALPASIAFVGDGLLKGAGDLRFLVIQMATASLIVFPVSLLITGKDLAGLWWAVAAWVCARGALSATRLLGTQWQRIATEQLQTKQAD